MTGYKDKSIKEIINKLEQLCLTECKEKDFSGKALKIKINSIICNYFKENSIPLKVYYNCDIVGGNIWIYYKTKSDAFILKINRKRIKCENRKVKLCFESFTCNNENKEKLLSKWIEEVEAKEMNKIEEIKEDMKRYQCSTIEELNILYSKIGQILKKINSLSEDAKEQIEK